TVSKTVGWGFKSLLACQVNWENKDMSADKTSNILNQAKWIVVLGLFALAVVGNSYYSEVAFLYRVLGVVGVISLALVVMATTTFGKSSLKLMSESRTELRRVVWPTRVETTQTFLVVFISIVLLCLFFWGLESLLSWLTKLVLG
ncbi:MAG: preprotein translocase subunit SecE, partial [Gammaproteobacteria bacterium]